ncbi:hypothetical protein PTKIN_Ptkin09bG0117100 [Pterospermum kingtungense]
MASIPSPVIFDILLLLPVKSLARFKALNKFCRSLITDQHFIRTHFRNGANKANNTLCFILSCMEHRNLNSIIHFVTVRDYDELAVVEYSTPVSFDSYNVLPSCNGLVCFYGLHGGVHVCNPSTKEKVRLPDINDAEGFRSLSCGFGFDEMSGEYKVLKFLEPLEADHFVDDLRVEIFTMGNNSWKTISFSVVSFDVGSEIFEAISPPESVSGKNWYNMYLVELRGELCLVDFDYEILDEEDRKRMDIWMFFKGNTVEKQHKWRLQATIVHPSEPIDTTRPVAFNGEEILLHGFIEGLGHLNCYNLQTGCFRPLKTKGIPSQCCHASHHVESLFPS